MYDLNFQGENVASFRMRQKRWFYKFLMVVKSGGKVWGDPVLHKLNVLNKFFTTVCVNRFVEFVAKFLIFFWCVLRTAFSLFLTFGLSIFTKIYQSKLYSLCLICNSTFLIFLSMSFLSQIRLCIAFFWSFFFIPDISFSSTFSK